MATILTLADAKHHLRITSADQDADIWAKTQEASAIVLAYLKGRAITVSTLTGIGGVATVTATHLHGLVTGDTVFIRGALQPEYNGEFTVTVTSTTTFTYVIAGTPATPATGALGIRAAATWTDVTAPFKVKAAAKLMLTHLWENRGEDMKTDADLWQAVKNLLVDLRDPALA